jgi:hypothetical protein
MRSRFTKCGPRRLLHVTSPTMPAGEIDMKSRFNILMSALSASLLTTLAPVTAQDAGRKSSMPVQAASTNAGRRARVRASQHTFRSWSRRPWPTPTGTIVAFYKNRTPPPGLDPATARELKHEYRRLAEIGTKAAQAADDLAEYHSRLAESMRSIYAEPVRPNPSLSSFGK